jgi:hypothetical protein
VINHAHLGEQIEAALGDGSDFGLHIATRPNRPERWKPPAASPRAATAWRRTLPGGQRRHLVRLGFLAGQAHRQRPRPRATPTCCWSTTRRTIPAATFASMARSCAQQPETALATLTYAGIGVFWPDFFATVAAGVPMKLRPLLDAGHCPRYAHRRTTRRSLGRRRHPRTPRRTRHGACLKQMSHKPYAKRRQRVLDSLGDGVAVLATAPERLRNRDSHYPYRFDSYFWYLSGFPEPDAVIVLVGGAEAKAILFCREKNEERETWDGFRYGPDAAPPPSASTKRIRSAVSTKCCPTLIANHAALWHSLGHDSEWDRRIGNALNAVRAQGRSRHARAGEIRDLRGLLDQMRLIKDAHEIELMRRAADIASAGHSRAMRACRPGMAEYELEAEAELRISPPRRRRPRLHADRRRWRQRLHPALRRQQQTAGGNNRWS